MDDIMRFPTAMKHEPAIDEWFDDRTSALSALVRPWFERMRACGSDVRELMHDGCPTACVGEAAFGYVAIFKAHANVGFFFGAELRDLADLLEGSGKRMRHVKVRPGETVDASALGALIDQAYADIRRRLSPRAPRR